MFFRKSMVERRAFGVWLISMALKRDKLDFESRVVGVKYSLEDVIEYMSNE